MQTSGRASDFRYCRVVTLGTPRVAGASPNFTNLSPGAARMTRLACLITLLLGHGATAVAQSNASAEAPMETVGPWAIWLFVLNFVGACVWFLLAVIRGGKGQK